MNRSMGCAASMCVLLAGFAEPATQPGASTQPTTVRAVLNRLPQPLRPVSGRNWTLAEFQDARQWIEAELQGKTVMLDTVKAFYSGGSGRTARFESKKESVYRCEWITVVDAVLSPDADAAFSAARDDDTWRVVGVADPATIAADSEGLITVTLTIKDAILPRR